MHIEQSNPPPNPAEPLPPFNLWSVQWSDPDVGFAWYATPATLVTQATPTHATARVADVLSNWVDLVLETHREEIERCGGLLGIHDWRRFRSYDSEARRISSDEVSHFAVIDEVGDTCDAKSISSDELGYLRKRQSRVDEEAFKLFALLGGVTD